MKKTIKRVFGVTTLVVLLALSFTLGGKVEANNQRVIWNGTHKADNTMLNLDKIGDLKRIIKELKESNNEQIKDIEYLDNYTTELLQTIKEYEKLIVNRDNAINELHGTINNRDNTINELTVIINDLEAQLEQAYKDISMIDTKLEGIISTQEEE